MPRWVLLGIAVVLVGCTSTNFVRTGFDQPPPSTTSSPCSAVVLQRPPEDRKISARPRCRMGEWLQTKRLLQSTNFKPAHDKTAATQSCTWATLNLEFTPVLAIASNISKQEQPCFRLAEGHGIAIACNRNPEFSSTGCGQSFGEIWLKHERTICYRGTLP
jgi:hypothetical protein